MARYCQAGLAKWNALSGQANAAARPRQPGFLAQLAGSLRQRLLPWLASAVIVLGGAVLALLWISDGARAGFTAGQLLQVDHRAGRDALLGAGRRERQPPVDARLLPVAAGRRLRRHPAGGAGAEPGATARRAVRRGRRHPPVRAPGRIGTDDRAGPGDLRHRQHQRGPRGAAGQGGFCVTLRPGARHLAPGEPGPRGGRRAEARTSDYEALVGQRRSTLFDVSAISGAAVSPLMGSATRHAYRILFTATNVRLGVWLPHPTLVRDARKAGSTQQRGGHVRRASPTGGGRGGPLLLLLWYLSPHPLWDRKADQNADREARLWAHVLQLRLRGKLRRGTVVPADAAHARAAVGRGRRPPELPRHLDVRDRRRPLRQPRPGRGAAPRRQHIVVLDASGDKADTWFTLGGAMALARSDAGVEIDLDPDHDDPGRHAAWPRARWSARGRTARSRRPPARPGLPEAG